MILLSNSGFYSTNLLFWLTWLDKSKSRSHWRCSIENDIVKNFTNPQENPCVRASFLIRLKASVCNIIKKEVLALLISCENCKIFKITFSREHLYATASVNLAIITSCVLSSCSNRDSTK